jgi:hypothetical protein
MIVIVDDDELVRQALAPCRTMSPRQLREWCMSECIGVHLDGTLAEITEGDASDYVDHPSSTTVNIPTMVWQTRGANTFW